MLRTSTLSSFRPRVEQLEQRELLAGQVLVPGTVQRTENQQFVAQCYEDVLHRPADVPGLTFWLGRLDAGVPRSVVAQALAQSVEGLGRAARDLYGNLLGRSADPEGLAAMTKLLAQIGSPELARAGMFGSTEYFQTRGGGTVNGFLNALYTDVLDREVDPTAAAFYGDRLSAGVSRTAVALDVIESQEGRERSVQEMYAQFLARSADAAGLAYHAAHLAGPGSELTVRSAILGSDECLHRSANHPGDVVTQWNSVLLDAIRVDRTAPPRASRIMAIVHIAVADAVYALSGLGSFYQPTPTPPAGASREAAAAAAAHRALVSLFPAQAATFDAALTQSLASIPAGRAKDDGLAFGRAVADGILALRASDGSGATVAYTPGTTVGDWQPTPPAFAAALLPQWPNVTPFVMTSGSQFRPAAPPALTSPQYAADLNEVKSLGSKTSTTRTTDQTVIANFWADGAGTFTPPGHWNQIAQDVAAQRRNTLTENARLFAALDLAQADAAIISWDAKYAFDLWRPITAIRGAGDDDNAATEADAAWEPLLVTPPFPTYTSGHSTFSGAADRVLTAFFGNVAFTTRSDDSTNIVRSFTSFAQAADEAGRSRVYGGIHFEFDSSAGLASGRALGQLVVQRFLGGTANG